MSDTLNQSSAISHALLIDFVWGDSDAHATHYTSWSEAITIGGTVYDIVDPLGTKIETRIKLEPGNQTGGVSDEPWNFTMVPVEPLNYLVRTSTFAQVKCTISEVDPTSETLTPIVLWSGYVSQVWNNPKDANGAIKAEIAGWRSLIQYPLGVEAKTACSRTFCDQWCGVDPGPIEQTGTVASITGKIMAITGISIPGGKPAGYWSMGHVRFDGLSITILDGSAGVSALQMLEQPPTEWVGQTVTCRPGCTKDYASQTGCTGWANTARFAGFGADKPSGSPIIYPR